MLAAKVAQWQARKGSEGEAARSGRRLGVPTDVRQEARGGERRLARVPHAAGEALVQARGHRAREATEEARRKASEEAAAKAKAEAEARIAAALDEEERQRLEAEAKQAERERADHEAKRVAAAEAAKTAEEARREAEAAEAEAERQKRDAAKVKNAKSAVATLAGKGSADKGSGGSLEHASSKSAAKPSGPPAKVVVDTEFEAVIMRDKGGLARGGPGGGPRDDRRARGARCGRQAVVAIRPGDLIIRVFEFETPTYDSVIASIQGASRTAPLELTLLRRPTKVLAPYSGIEMRLGSGAKRSWRMVSIEILNSRDVRYAIKDGAGSGLIPMRDAREVRIVDIPGGAGEMVARRRLSCGRAAAAAEPKALNTAHLHLFYRRALRLFPQLGTLDPQGGVAAEEGRGGSHFSKRWYVLVAAAMPIHSLVLILAVYPPLTSSSPSLSPSLSRSP